MSRKLRNLNRMLRDKLGEMRLFGQAEQKGPILNVSVQQIPGDQVDQERLREVMRAVVEASLVEGIRKVTISGWLRGQTTEEPEWTTSFEYAPIAVEKVTHASDAYRRDYPLIRVIFFVLAVVGGSLYILQDRNLWALLPSALALLLGIFFPWLKRQVNRWIAPLFRRMGLGAGVILLGLSLYLFWTGRLELIFISSPLLLLGLLLMGLGA